MFAALIRGLDPRSGSAKALLLPIEGAGRAGGNLYCEAGARRVADGEIADGEPRGALHQQRGLTNRNAARVELGAASLNGERLRAAIGDG